LTADSDDSVGRCAAHLDGPSPAELNQVDSNRAALNRVGLNQAALNRVGLNRVDLNRVDLNRVGLVCQVSPVPLTVDLDATAGFPPAWLGDRAAAGLNPAGLNPADSNRVA